MEVENKGSTKKVINKLFNGECTEYEDFVQFDNLVFHARVSDYQGKLPTCGYKIQAKIKEKEKAEQQKREEQEEKKNIINIVIDSNWKYKALFQCIVYKNGINIIPKKS